MQNAVFFQPYLYLQHNKTEDFHTFVINNNQSFVSQVLKVVNCLSEKFDFSFPWDLIFKGFLILRPQKNQGPFSQSVKMMSERANSD